jgi:hypothetical protein
MYRQALLDVTTMEMGLDEIAITEFVCVRIELPSVQKDIEKIETFRRCFKSSGAFTEAHQKAISEIPR